MREQEPSIATQGIALSPLQIKQSNDEGQCDHLGQKPSGFLANETLYQLSYDPIRQTGEPSITMIAVHGGYCGAKTSRTKGKDVFEEKRDGRRAGWRSLTPGGVVE